MCPQEFKRGGELLTLATPPRVGPKTLADPQPTRVGKRGVHGGKAPMAGGCGGVPPQIQKRGEFPTLATPPRVGHKTLVDPQPTRVGETWGSRGRSPMAGGCGGCPPTNSKEGASCHISNHATSGTQNAGEP